MSTKEKMYQELEDQNLHPGWVGSSIRIDQALMIRFYPDGETIELLRFFSFPSGSKWKSMAITTDTYTIALVAKAQLQIMNGFGRGMKA